VQQYRTIGETPRARKEDALEPESEPGGSYLALVLRATVDADGRCRLQVTDARTAQRVSLVSGTLLVRLWRTSDDHLLRGTVRLNGTDLAAPFQSNAQLATLVQGWLAGLPAVASDGPESDDGAG
jgi:hypothetical protein